MTAKITRINGRILGRLEVSEKSVHFGALKSGQALTKVVILSAPYGERLLLVRVDNSKKEVFVAEFAETPETKDGTLPITIATTGLVPDGTPSGIVKGTLEFHTRVGESDETARVEVYGLVE